MHACVHARVSSSPGWPQIPVVLRLGWNSGPSHLPDLNAGIRAPATVLVRIYPLVTLFLIHWEDFSGQEEHSPCVLPSLLSLRLDTAKLRDGHSDSSGAD